MTKALEQAIIDGDGTGKPKGILAETPEAGQAIESDAPAYADLIAAEAALPQAYENGAVWCMSKKTFMQYYGLTDTNGQPIGRVNYGLAGKPERTLLGRPVVCCDYVKSYASTLETGDVFAFLFNFKDYVLNTNCHCIHFQRYRYRAAQLMVCKSNHAVFCCGMLLLITAFPLAYPRCHRLNRRYRDCHAALICRSGNKG